MICSLKWIEKWATRDLWQGYRHFQSSRVINYMQQLEKRPQKERSWTILRPTYKPYLVLHRVWFTNQYATMFWQFGKPPMHITSNQLFLTSLQLSQLRTYEKTTGQIHIQSIETKPYDVFQAEQIYSLSIRMKQQIHAFNKQHRSANLCLSLRALLSPPVHNGDHEWQYCRNNVLRIFCRWLQKTLRI